MATSIENATADSTVLTTDSMTTQECELMKAVDQRDARLKSDVQHEVLSKLLLEIEQLRSIRSSVKTAAAQEQQGGELCTCCAQRLSMWSFRGAGEPCPKCGEKTCENCQRELIHHYHAKAALGTNTDNNNKNVPLAPTGIWQKLCGNLFKPNDWLCRYCFKLMQTVVIEYQFGTPEVAIEEEGGVGQRYFSNRKLLLGRYAAKDELDSSAMDQQKAFAELTQAERNHLRQVIARDQEFRACIRNDFLTKLEYEVRVLLRQRDLARELSASSVSSPTSKSTKSLFAKSTAEHGGNESTCLTCLRVLSRFSSAGAGQVCPVCALRVCLHCQVHVPKMPAFSESITTAIDDGNHLKVYDASKKRASWVDKITSLRSPRSGGTLQSAAWLCTCCFKMLQINLFEKQFSEKFEHSLPSIGIDGGEEDAAVAAVSKALPVSKSLANLNVLAVAKPRAASGLSDINSDQYSHVARPVQYLPLPVAPHHHHAHHHHISHHIHRPHFFGHAKSSPELLTITISSSESSDGGSFESGESGKKTYEHKNSTSKVHVHKLKKKKMHSLTSGGQLSVKREDAVRVHGDNSTRRSSVQIGSAEDNHSKQLVEAHRATTISGVHEHMHTSTNTVAVTASIHQAGNGEISSSYDVIAFQQQQSVSFSGDTVFERVPKIVIGELTSADTSLIDIEPKLSPNAAVKRPPASDATRAMPVRGSSASQSLPAMENMSNPPNKPARLLSGVSIDSVADETLMFGSPCASPTPSVMSALKGGTLRPQQSAIGMDGLAAMFAMQSPAVSMYGTPVGTDAEDDESERNGKNAAKGRDVVGGTSRWAAGSTLAKSKSESKLGRSSAEKPKTNQANLSTSTAALDILANLRGAKFYTPSPNDEVDHRRRRSGGSGDKDATELNRNLFKSPVPVESGSSPALTTRAAVAQAARDAAAVKLRYALFFDKSRQQVVFTLIGCSNLPLLSADGQNDRGGVYQLASTGGESGTDKATNMIKPSVYAKIRLLPEHVASVTSLAAASVPSTYGEAKQHHGHGHRLLPHFGGAARSHSPGGLHRQGSFSSVMSHTPLAATLGTGEFKHTTSTVKHDTNPNFNETVHLPRGLSPSMLEAQGRYLFVQIKHREKSSNWVMEKKWLVGEARIMLTERGIKLTAEEAEEAEEQEIELELSLGGKE